MPHSAASDLGLYCLPMSLLWDARHNGLILSGKIVEDKLVFLKFQEEYDVASTVKRRCVNVMCLLGSRCDFEFFK